MNSFHQSRAPRANILAYVTTVTIILIIVDVFSGGFLRRTARDVLIVPAYWGEQLVSSVRAIPFIAGSIAYRNEFIALQNEVDVLRERSTLLDAKNEENERLRQIIGFSESDQKKIVAAVVSPVSARQFGTLLVNAGASQGVRDGQIVLSEHGYALGEIESAGETSARVALYFAPHATLEVTSGSVQFTLEGRGAGNARAQVPRELVLTERDVLYSPRAGARPVGIIGHLSSASSSAFTDVYALVPVNLETVRFVVIISQ